MEKNNDSNDSTIKLSQTLSQCIDRINRSFKKCSQFDSNFDNDFE